MIFSKTHLRFEGARWELFFANGAVPGVEGFVAGKKAQEIEEAQGYRWVDLCKKHNLEFVVYSGLCDAKQLSGGKHVNIYHFQGKAKVNNSSLHCKLVPQCAPETNTCLIRILKVMYIATSLRVVHL